ncbi:isopeptide-forming domain-containing fimbrial protein [Enterococcus rivorum]|uniref:isopeptide-forming domain-containing fimbrial protein n=1 Tax=Enterococcus rivorum TaxID=762845 RepID=UPI0036407588
MKMVFETKTLPAGQYLVIDVQSEPGTIQTAAPVIVSLPMMLADGTGWNDQVHVYTKNEVLLGAAKVMKTSDNNQPLAGAIFSLYKVNDSGPDQLVMSSLTSHNDGYTDIVGNLVLGDYYFLETRAPSGYLVNQSKSSFSITMSDQAYDTNGNLINSQVKVSSLQNFLQPQINKTLLTNASSDLGATVSWEITADVPTDIAEYTQYIVTDTLDSQLSYKGNLVVSADGVQVNPTNYLATVNNGQLTITFLDSMNEIGETMLLGKKELEITFDTVINSTAIPGAAIPNTAV